MALDLQCDRTRLFQPYETEFHLAPMQPFFQSDGFWFCTAGSRVPLDSEYFVNQPATRI